jgi:hypothetical protein
MCPVVGHPTELCEGESLGIQTRSDTATAEDRVPPVIPNISLELLASCFFDKQTPLTSTIPFVVTL